MRNVYEEPIVNSGLCFPRARKFNLYLILVILFISISALWYFSISDLAGPSFPNIPEIWRDRACSSSTSLALDDAIPNDVAHNHTENAPFRFKHVAVASNFGFHFDVYMTVVWTLTRVFRDHHLSGDVQVFAPQPFGFGFNSIVESLRLYDGAVRQPEELVSEVARGQIDMVVLGTCEVDLRWDWNNQLLEIWDKREPDNKFTVVCIVHHSGDLAWQGAITEWARRDSIRLLPISEHVARTFRHKFLTLADSTDPVINSAGYENIPVDVHVPILNLTYGDILPHPIVSKSKLSSAVIQGSFNADRRDYSRIFQDLTASLQRNPQAWGYLPLNSTAATNPDSLAQYEIDTTLDDPPFHLFLIGSGYLDIPPPLKNIVSVHTDLNYTDFYRLMGTMDICLPAFSDDVYYEQQASSTFAMALECDVPILGTRRLRQSYTYADDDRAIVTRPAGLRDIAALRVLRTGMPAVENGTNLKLLEAEKSMVTSSWQRKDVATWEVFKEKVWMENRRVAEKLLRGQM